MLSAQASLAQTYLMNGTPINDCNGTFYDSGGANGNYNNNQNLSTTICSDGSAGTHIQLNFSGTDLAPGDELCFYDGPNATATLLSCASDYTPGEPFIVQATAVNASGCLTVTFTSTAAGVATGWGAVINCVASCQQVQADVVSTNPATVPADTGWIDVCPGERIFFNGKGVYPQNGFAYAQSDLTTSFEWNFGDGAISYGPNTSHRFDDPGGYYVQLFLSDVQGCRSTNLINQRIRVAPRPNFNLTGGLNNTICAGDTIHLSAAVDSATGKTLVVTPNASSFAAEGSRADSLALPDGTGIGYETSIYFTEFSPGQVLTNANDLESICVNMEHSWMRDMEISLSCPNGQSIILHNFAGQTGGQVFLGIPNDNDGFNPIPGIGYDYCWTPTATNPTWIQYANTVLGGSGTLPEGNYSTFSPMSNLVGCPLNGEWTIKVTDLWPIDNGYIFSWSLKFKDILYPNIETFTPQFTSWNWNNHPSIFYTSPDSIAAAPLNAGTAGYVFTVNDEFGCSWDTLVNIAVLPATHPSCYTCNPNFPALQDTAVCLGESVSFLATSITLPTQEVRFEAFPDYKLGNGNHPHSNPYTAPISINSLGFNLLSNPITQITSVCMEIETDFDADLNVYLRSPDGKQIELTTGNGGGGDNYKITCFTPTAVTPIVGSAAPFNGTYKPEGAWSALNNAVVNGDWKLVVSDGFGPTQTGKVKWWSMGFNYTDNISYSWTNAASLSCNNCPTPTATPASSTTYILTANNSFNCVYKDTVSVGITAFFPAPPNLQAGLTANGINWTWNPVPGASSYEVNINGGGWQVSNGPASHTVNGLSSGDLVNIEVRALGGSPNCPPLISIGSSVFVICTMFGTLDAITPALCAGTATGSAFISVSNANPPVEFLPNGGGPIFPNGDILNVFAAGTNFVIIRDAMGCLDTITFVTLEPSPLLLSTSVTAVKCHGENTGSATATASGGTLPYTYTWQGCAGGATFSGPTISSLLAGCYKVTASDGNGCSGTATITITEPAAFMFTSSQDSVTCFGGSDGSATINVTGGTMPYTYFWDNASTMQTAAGLNANFHTVFVRDSNNCEAVTLVQVLQPSQLILDSVAVKSVTCFGLNNGTATVFTRGGTTPYAYTWNDAQAQTTKKAQNLAAGTYTVTVTDANGCSVVATAIITAPAQLIVGITNITHETCAGACNGGAMVQASGGSGVYNYLWNNPNVPIGTQTAANLCPGQYTVTVQDNIGCTDTDEFVINNAPVIVIQFISTAPACAGLLTGSLQSTVTGGAPAYQYNWSTGFSGGPNLQNVGCGIYSVTITDSLGCTKTASDTIVCPTVIQIGSIVPQVVACFGESNGQITVQAQGGSGQLSYIWSDPAAQTGTTATGLPAGTYTVTVTDTNGCTNSASAVVMQPLALGISFVKTDITCFNGSDGTLTATASGGNSNYAYTWNIPQTGPQITNLSAGAYTVTVTDAQGCTASATSPVVGQPATDISVAVIQTTLSCFGGQTGEAAATASGGNGGPFTYSWNNGQSGPAATNLGLGTYTVTATDAKGCSVFQNIGIQQFDSIQVNAAFAPPSCFGVQDAVAGINFVMGGAGGGDTLLYDYQWSIPNSPNATSVGNLAGNQTYFLTVTDQQGCSGVFNVYIPEPAQIILQTSQENVTCLGAADGVATLTGVQNAVGTVTYIWSTGPGGTEITGLSTGFYTVTATDANGCTAMATFELKEPAVLGAAFDVTQLLCTNDQNAAIGTMVQGGTPDYIYQWSNGATSANLQNLGPGAYSVTITDKNGCTLTGLVDIAKPDSMMLQTEGIDPKCFGDANGRLKVSASGGKLPYRYSINGDAFGGSSTFIALTAGTYTLQAIDANGCIATAIAVLNQPLPVEVDAGPDTTIILGQSVLLSADVFNAFGTVVYAWRSALVETFMCVDSSLCNEILVTPPYSNTYIISVVDERGCRAEASVKVFVEKPRGVYVPTGFSPDGNGDNDLLVVHGKSAQIREVSMFRLFDRWGELLYEDSHFPVNDMGRGWDGRFRGKDCDPGVYVWHVEVEYIDGYTEALSGNTTLIR